MEGIRRSGVPWVTSSLYHRRGDDSVFYLVVQKLCHSPHIMYLCVDAALVELAGCRANRSYYEWPGCAQDGWEQYLIRLTTHATRGTRGVSCGLMVRMKAA